MSPIESPIAEADVRNRFIHRVTERGRVWVVAGSEGLARVKSQRWKGRDVSRAPEYEDCLALARRHGVPLKTVYQAALAAVAHPR